MKIRTGFVSNSSGSSFCIYGVSLCSQDVPEELWERLNDYDGEDLGILKNYSAQEGNDNHYLGRDWSGIGDNETGAQLKASVVEALALLGIKMTPGTIEEGWYSG